MKKIKFNKINILIRQSYYISDNLIIIKKEDYKSFKKMREELLIKLAKLFNNDFYINDGYFIEIKNYSFNFSYDNGSEKIPIYAI